MKLFNNPITIDQYIEIIDFIIESENPIYCYRLENNIIISQKEIENIDDEEKMLIDEKLNDELNQDDLDELSDFYLDLNL